MFKNLILISSIAICVLAANQKHAASQKHAECVKKYGSGWFKSPYDSCNDCTCGTINSLMCTKMGCSPKKIKVNNKHEECVKKYGSGFFKSPYDSCNRCKCGTINSLSCTRMACSPKKINVNTKRQECIKKYGSGSFKSPYDSCNTCTCGTIDSLVKTYDTSYYCGVPRRSTDKSSTSLTSNIRRDLVLSDMNGFKMSYTFIVSQNAAI
ncbi:hypothetical protein BB561_005885 [Smittium simulii]|uniref:Pacifastin domain-containing protein n=1 Tax=Smittium simulii TaxID=133385 RepID=A0A2T9Y7V5_9FUNG|nr:hypothetical protein BB561_005885 [Smittium simulii]